MDQYGSDFLTIVDEDGTEYELEVLSTLEYDGNTYLAVIPAEESQDSLELEVSILKSVEEDGEFVNLNYEYEQVPFERIRRITGYLVGDMRHWNNAKRAEERDRVKHL